MGTQTQILVRVIAKGGKYLGDDIGGALVTIKDVQTGELLASGTTGGGSGVKKLMELCVTRSEVLTTEDASVFTASLDLEGPRLIKVTARGPLAAQQSAGTASVTQWVCPVADAEGLPRSITFLLEIPGLVVQVINPPTHFMPAVAPEELEVRANVTMMCGCPISPSTFWNPAEFDARAVVTQPGGYRAELALRYDAQAEYGAPSQFAAAWRVPANDTGQLAIYEMTVTAFQPKTGNTGADRATVIIPVPSATGGAGKLSQSDEGLE